jgi:hypothetical protein
MPDHIIANAGLAHVNAEFEEFAVNAGCAPEGVLATHPADQFTNLFLQARTAALSVPDLLGPEPS